MNNAWGKVAPASLWGKRATPLAVAIGLAFAAPLTASAAGGTTLTISASGLVDDSSSEITCEFTDGDGNVAVSAAGTVVSANEATCTTPAWAFAAASGIVLSVKAGDVDSSVDVSHLLEDSSSDEDDEIDD